LHRIKTKAENWIRHKSAWKTPIWFSIQHWTPSFPPPVPFSPATIGRATFRDFPSRSTGDSRLICRHHRRLFSPTRPDPVPKFDCSRPTSKFPEIRRWRRTFSSRFSAENLNLPGIKNIAKIYDEWIVLLCIRIM